VLSYVKGLTGSTMVLRAAPTVGNYDYIADIEFREYGDIEVETVFASRLEARRFDPAASPEVRRFSSILRPDLAAPVHSHMVNWRADFDIAGVKENTMQLTRVKDESAGSSRGRATSRAQESTSYPSTWPAASSTRRAPTSQPSWPFRCTRRPGPSWAAQRSGPRATSAATRSP